MHGFLRNNWRQECAAHQGSISSAEKNFIPGYLFPLVTWLVCSIDLEASDVIHLLLKKNKKARILTTCDPVVTLLWEFSVSRRPSKYFDRVATKCYVKSVLSVKAISRSLSRPSVASKYYFMSVLSVQPTIHSLTRPISM